MESAVTNMRRRLDGMAGAAARAGALLTAPMVAVGKAVDTTSAAVNRLEASTGASAQELARFKEQAYQVGSRLPLDTADILKAQTTFIRLGNSIKQAYEATPALARFTVAADNVEIADSAKYASIAMNTFGLEASFTGQLLDKLAKIERVSAGAARGVGEAFAFSAANAKAADMDIDEYIGTLGTVAMAGREVESVSQGLGLFLTNIQRGIAGVGRGSSLVRKVFTEALGINMEEVKDTFKQPRGFTKLLQLINERSQGRDEAYLETAMAGLAGTSYSSAFGWLVRNVDKLTTATAEMETATGESERQVNIMLKGLSGARIRFKAMIDTLLNRMGDWFIAKPLEQMVRRGEKFLNFLTEVDAEGNPAQRTLLKLASSAMLAGPALIGLAAALKLMSFALLPVVPLLRLTGLAFGAFAGVWKFAGAMLIAGNRARTLKLLLISLMKPWSFIGGPAGLAAVAVLAALAGAIILFWKPISTFVTGAIDGFKSALKGALASSGSMRAALRELWKSLKALAAAFGPPVERMLEWISGARQTDQTAAGLRFGKIIVSALVGIVRAVTTAIEWYTKWVRLLSDAGWIAFVFGVLQALANGWIAVVNTIRALIEFIGRVARGENVFEAGRDLMKTFLDGMLSFAKPLYDGAKSLFEGTIGRLLPQSDAKAGPFSKLSMSGRSAVETFAMGARRSSSSLAGMGEAFSSALPTLRGFQTPFVAGPVPVAAGAGGITLRIQIDKVEIDARGGDAEKIKIGLRDIFRDAGRQAAEQLDSRFKS